VSRWLRGPRWDTSLPRPLSQPVPTGDADPPADPAGDRSAGGGALGPQTGSALVWKAVEYGGVRLLTLLRTVLLARLLAPSDFGALAVAIVITDLLVIVTDFGVVQSLVQLDRPTRRHEAAAWTVGLIRATAIATILLLAAPIVASAVGQPEATNIIRLLALRPFIDALASIRLAELTRRLRFRPLALRTLPGAVVEVIAAVALAAVFGVEGVAMGALAGVTVATALSYRVAPWRPRLELDRDVIRPLIRFGRWFLIAGAVWAAGDALLYAIISRRLGADDLGVYFIAARIALLPAFMANAVAEMVTFSLHARLWTTNDPRAPRVFGSAVRLVAALLVPIYGLMAALAPPLVLLVLGERWEAAIPVVRVLTIVGLCSAISIVALPMLQARGRARDAAALSFVRAAVLVALVWVLVPWGVMGAAAAVVIAELALQVGAVVSARRSLTRPFAGVGRAIIGIAGVTALAAVVALALDWAVPGLVGLMLAVLASVSVTGVALFVMDRRFDLGLIRDVGALYALPGGSSGRRDENREDTT
jgi:lipopolysaccharide exporter